VHTVSRSVVRATGATISTFRSLSSSSKCSSALLINSFTYFDLFFNSTLSGSAISFASRENTSKFLQLVFEGTCDVTPSRNTLCKAVDLMINTWICIPPRIHFRNRGHRILRMFRSSRKAEIAYSPTSVSFVLLWHNKQTLIRIDLRYFNHNLVIMHHAMLLDTIYLLYLQTRLY